MVGGDGELVVSLRGEGEDFDGRGFGGCSGRLFGRLEVTV